MRKKKTERQADKQTNKEKEKDKLDKGVYPIFIFSFVQKKNRKTTRQTDKQTTFNTSVQRKRKVRVRGVHFWTVKREIWTSITVPTSTVRQNIFGLLIRIAFISCSQSWITKANFPLGMELILLICIIIAVCS